jgi:hypothetical protein
MELASGVEREVTMDFKGAGYSAGAVVLALLIGEPGPTLAAGANPFDGTWNLEVVCPMSADAQGYTWRLPVRIASGVLSGKYHSPTNEAQGVFSGQVRPDGGAIVSVSGRTGPDEYSVGHVRPGTRFHYTAKIQFSGGSGSGERQQLRPCTLTLSRT